MGMILTDEQQAILDGAKGETMAKVMKTLVMFGEAFRAEKMVPVTSRYNHLVTSFGLKAFCSPVYDLMQQLIDAGAVSGQQFSADPRPLDPNVPGKPSAAAGVQEIYVQQAGLSMRASWKSSGLLKDKDAFTCTCYLSEQLATRPEKGEVLSWAESSAVVYANSVLGARCNRNSGIMDLHGLHRRALCRISVCSTDEGRRATWVVKVETVQKARSAAAWLAPSA